ncbi:bifunctional phosphopantothenoylcysteine decarboxylase/phosphopantothenate--cysteine ligase CoaBC [Georgenia sp. 311]|uniref:Coenzyme A biosynthesis bifunctional protein CoaBC n=1 Tax=Georgenia wutianyii TaxID=2585135 RepID=A0ABX5VS30_9MICO|nr:MULTISPECIES: bifunctional phosphopantothenoylcysteine decarboxylase/phosphopantothenate--cysteine ligase CoaBC [Georgenia]QDB80736.1 bifunctional phosphopantothenoylcysteine decarboxylase/phosphopantothenate--cysteine ligase CoaBC [Georgenia wutianyii]TNC19210.1 bifunctional phosphopantothenoylcysteine decarboxylase/phosphopantothenate--cysteine ligase CoaBC [Georgenia sp. 311]
MRVLLGVTGGIAAYKAVLVLRALREAGHRVRVIPTAAALEFVGRPTWEALSGEPVTTSVFDGATEVDHVALGRSADLVVVAPATADLLARAASGRADDLLTTTLLTVTAPVLLAPAMHTEMWLHPATVANVATLRARGVTVLEPDSGRLTGTDSGPGRLPEPATITAAALALLAPQDLAGRTVVVTAGGTREPLDPVRFLGNRSSGRQGVEIAVEAARRGARVRLIAASVDASARALAAHPAVEVTDVETTAELAAAVDDATADADVLVMAAAVADFRPRTTAERKIKKGEGAPEVLDLVQNPDILATVAARPRDHLVVVGFAAETGDPDEVLELGRAKARRKGADLLAVNAVGKGRGFGDVDNAVTVLGPDGAAVGAAAGTKHDVARGLWDLIVPRLR